MLASLVVGDEPAAGPRSEQGTSEQRQRLADNGLMLRCSQASEPVPVVHLFHVSGRGHWLLVSIHAREPYIAYGIAELVLGFAEYGPIDLQELADLPVQLDAS